MSKALPDVIARTRKSICRCNCTINFSDPCATCPQNNWNKIFCNESEPLTNQGSFPSITQMAKNFATSLGEEAKAKIKGTAKLSEDESSRRFSICEECEFFHSPSRRCKKCGCFLKWKTTWRSQKCPIGKW